MTHPLGTVLTNKEYSDLISENHGMGSESAFIKQGFIKWNDDDADMFSGPFKGNFAYFRIFFVDTKITTDEVIKRTYSDEGFFYTSLYDKISGFCFNKYEEFFKEHSKSLHMMLFFYKIDPHRCFPFMDIIEKYHKEIEEIEKICELPHEEALKHFLESEYKDELNKSIQWHIDESLAHGTKDIPYRIYMAGNDDTSYSKCFSENDWENAWKKIVEKPDFDTLNDLKFVFTN